MMQGNAFMVCVESKVSSAARRRMGVLLHIGIYMYSFDQIVCWGAFRNQFRWIQRNSSSCILHQEYREPLLVENMSATFVVSCFEKNLFESLDNHQLTNSLVFSTPLVHEKTEDNLCRSLSSV